MPDADRPRTPNAENDKNAGTLAAAVSRFTHDVASPLMVVSSLSALLVREGRADAQTVDDLRRIQAAADEIGVMVRALGERGAPRRAADDTRQS